MKTNSIYTYLIILLLTISSCSVDAIRIATGDEVSYRNITVGDYSEIEISNDLNAYITFSDTEESIEIEANEVLQGFITTSISNNKLIIKMKGSVSIKGNATLNVHIKTKSITNFTASADSKIYLENILTEDSAEINLSSDSYFSGEIHLEHLKIKTTSDAKADLYGFVDTLDANIASDAELSDYDLEVNDLEIKMASDAKAYLTINETIDVDGSSDATLYYKGNAHITNKDLSSDARVVNKN